jgi:hypothetical protein
MEEEISELYNFNYNCVYHIDNIENKSQYKYDLEQIISTPPNNEDLYIMKLYGIFTILNNNQDTRYIFNLLRKKLPEDLFHNETDILHNNRLFYKILSYDFLYLYHPCICNIYHDNVIKPENLNRLLERLNRL